MQINNVITNTRIEMIIKCHLPVFFNIEITFENVLVELLTKLITITDYKCNQLMLNRENQLQGMTIWNLVISTTMAV